MFNVCFILPLLGIVATLWFAGSHAQRMLSIGRNFLERNWPVILASLALIAGLFVIALGATGFAARGHGRFGRFIRRFRHLLHP